MKIALPLVLALTIIVCGASATSASGVLKQNYDSQYYERQLRDFVFSVQQIVAEAGAGAQIFTATANQLENSLNRGKLAELWSKFKVEIQKEPFDEIFQAESLLEEFDPNLENLGTRARTFARRVIRTIVDAINANPNFPEQSIVVDDAVSDLFDEIYEPLATLFGTLGFLITYSGPLFPVFYALVFMEEYQYEGYSDLEPIKLIWSLVQEASQYIQMFYGILIDDIVQFQSVFALNVNPDALPYFQIAQTQVSEAFAFYLNLIGEPFNLPGFVPVVLKIAQKAFDATRTIVPKLIDQPEIWSTAEESISDVIEDFTEEFEANGEPDVTSANFELYYIGLFDKILAMSIFQ